MLDKNEKQPTKEEQKERFSRHFRNPDNGDVDNKSPLLQDLMAGRNPEKK